MNTFQKSWALLATSIAGIAALFSAVVLTGAVVRGITTEFTAFDLQSAITATVPIGLGVCAYFLTKRIFRTHGVSSANTTNLFILYSMNAVAVLWTVAWVTSLGEPILPIKTSQAIILITIYITIPFGVLLYASRDRFEIDPAQVYLRAIASTPIKFLIFYAALVLGAIIPLAVGDNLESPAPLFWPWGFVEAAWHWRSLLFIPFLLVLWICYDLYRYLFSPQTIQPLFSAFTISYIIFLRAADDAFWPALAYGGIYLIYRHLPTFDHIRKSEIEST